MTQDIGSIGIPQQERVSTGIHGLDFVPGGDGSRGAAHS